MHATLERRLVALEADRASKAAMQRPFMGAANLMVLLIAGHLGGMMEQEAVAEAYGRALGYESGSDLRSALRAEGAILDGEEHQRRHREAVDRLLAMKGSSQNVSQNVR
jgi:hypothetical protein